MKRRITPMATTGAVLIAALLSGGPPAAAQDTPSARQQSDQQAERARQGHPPTGQQPFANQQPQPRVTDESIQQAVRQKLKGLDGIDASRLQIESNDRIVTVTGTVNSLLEGDRIMQAIGAVRGVDSVITHFSVEPEQRTDRQIEQQVRAALAFDPVTSATGINVTVKDGVVSLSGEAKTWAEKRLASWLTWDVRGVREIRNEVTVARADVPDAEIKAAIERRFESDPLVNGDITINVQNGRVTLSGEVASAVQKEWAVIDAHISGVREVDASGLRVNPNAAESVARQRRHRSDEQIQTAISEAFQYDPRVLSFNPQVEVNNGVVTLSGPVSNLRAKQTAVQIAENTAGVREVRDNLSVQTPPRPEDEIARELRTAYDRSLIVDADQVNVRVENGRAVLTGTVDSNFERWAAGETASRTRGVTAVDNQLRVDDAPEVAATPEYNYPWRSAYSPWIHSTTRESKTDAELLTDVRNHLFWSPFVDSEDISVTIKDGVITLVGEVDSRMEKGAAEDNAYQAGATRVNNRLHVLEPTGR